MLQLATATDETPLCQREERERDEDVFVMIPEDGTVSGRERI